MAGLALLCDVGPVRRTVTTGDPVLYNLQAHEMPWPSAKKSRLVAGGRASGADCRSVVEFSWSCDRIAIWGRRTAYSIKSRGFVRRVLKSLRAPLVVLVVRRTWLAAAPARRHSSEL